MEFNQILQNPPQCIITGTPMSSYGPLPQTIEDSYRNPDKRAYYTVATKHGNQRVETTWEMLRRLPNDPHFRKHRHLIASAWHHDMRLFQEEDIITPDLFRQRLATASLPKTPKEKLDYILKYVNDHSEQAGARVELLHYPQAPESAVLHLYMRNVEELRFYLMALANDDLLDISLNDAVSYAMVTAKGLRHLAALEERGGQLSTRCFVAMAFDPSRAEARDAIVRAIEACGYTAVIIDSQHIESDKTINDRIIAEIRRSKFCIADFTLQRNGIYFEAGFALGLGIPVIYLCDTADFQNSHFDLKPFQHLLYTSADELYSSLQDKISAWIK